MNKFLDALLFICIFYGGLAVRAVFKATDIFKWRKK